jgi:leucyl/phenylalanyl-tRNA--protein transferase
LQENDRHHLHNRRSRDVERLRNRRVRRTIVAMIAPEVLLQGYRLGVFPMAMDDGSIEWFSPDPRGILPLDLFHVPHALQRVVAKGTFEIRINTSFADVMQACAERDETWINEEIIASYTELHEMGCAHSVEAWQDGELAGGLYGVSIGGAFFGESMFHRVTDASKVALCALIDRLRAQKFMLLDTQWLTPHLARFGGIEISRRQYMYLLTRAVALQRSFV